MASIRRKIINCVQDEMTVKLVLSPYDVDPTFYIKSITFSFGDLIVSEVTSSTERERDEVK